MKMSVEDVLLDMDRLVSLPASCARVNEMVDDPDSSAADIGRVIAQDTALTARLLRIANSPFYGFSAQIDTVSRAVAVLGVQQIRSLLLATSARQAFEGIPNQLVSMQSFWEHSIYCALAARTLAQEGMKHQRESLFVAGLLHDVGSLVLYYRLPDLSRQALEMARKGHQQGRQVYQAERELMGLDHAEVGGGLLRIWGLPSLLSDCVACHHDPLQAGKRHVAEVALVHIANSLAHLAERDTLDVNQAPPIHPQAWKAAGLQAGLLEPVVRGVQAQIGDVRSLLGL